MTNNLATKFPELLKEWDYELNTIHPDQVTAGSNKKVWWKCNNNHKWETTIHCRTSKDRPGCPYCAGKKVLKGFNDLATRFPDIVKEWNYSKNTINPDQVTLGSNKKVWWKCSNNHKWETTICNRTIVKSGCPYCKKGLK